MNKKGHGYRGYIGTRPYNGVSIPQNVQNFLIRSYCQKHQFTYLLSGTEYTMPGCYMILEEIIDNIYSIEGIVLFSIFMLPALAKKRKRIYEAILSSGRTLHAALEDISVNDQAEIQIVEDIIELNKIVLHEQSMTGLRNFVLPKADSALLSFETNKILSGT